MIDMNRETRAALRHIHARWAVAVREALEVAGVTGEGYEVPSDSRQWASCASEAGGIIRGLVAEAIGDLYTDDLYESIAHDIGSLELVDWTAVGEHFLVWEAAS